MKIFVLTILVILLSVGGGAVAQPRVDVEVKAGTASSRALTAKEQAAIDHATTSYNKSRGCDLVAKTCPRGQEFLSADVYLARQIEDVLSRLMAQFGRDQQRDACETYKSLTATDKQAIKDKLRGNSPCD